ncbi:MAG TPA: ABC transporter permease [Mycobacteriales bacterium]|nr:ABC transporter permease [Mycobacteriales bacterium]
MPAGLFPLLAWLAGGLLLGFILLPVLGLVTASSPESLSTAMADSAVRDALLVSVMDAAITAVIGTVFAVPLAYLLARHRFPGRALVQSVIDLPLAIPHTVAGIALLFVFGRTGWIGAPASAVGLAFYGTHAGIVVAMLFVSAPFAFNSARVAFEALDQNVERAARSLGATPWQAFRRVTLPLAWRGVLTGAVLVYARSISEFGAVVILAYFPATAPVTIYNLFLSSGLTDSASAAVLLLIVALATFLVLRTLASGWFTVGAEQRRR